MKSNELNPLIINIMKSNELKAPYETPELNETAVSVENGFAQSPDGYTSGGAGSYDDFVNDNGSY